MAKLTALQQDFLNKLFGKCNGNIKAAAKEVGIDDYTNILTDELTEAIKKRADSEIVLNVPRAVHVIQKMIEAEGDGIFVSDKLHKVAADLLDRAGLSKQERPNSGGSSVGLVFLPTKQALPEPPPAPDVKEQTSLF